MTPKISVIMPTYNRRAYLEQALSYLRRQTLQPIEFLLIDDASTDGSYKYMQEHTKNDRRFKILKMPQNSGPYACRNVGLKVAKGEYIGFFDCDDAIPDDYFASLYENAQKNSADIVYTNYNNLKHNINYINNLVNKLQALRNGALWDKIYNTAFLRQHNIIMTEGLYTADNIFVLKAFYYAQKIVLLEKPRYLYTLRPDSIGKDESKQEKRTHDVLSVCKEIVEFMHDKNLQLIEKMALYDFLRRSLFCYPQDAEFVAEFNKLMAPMFAFCAQIKPVLIAKILVDYNDNNDIKRITNIKDLQRAMKAIAQKYKNIDKPLHRKDLKSMSTGLLKAERMLHLISKEKYKEKRNIELIKASGLFDAKWYVEQNPELKSSKIKPVKHYYKFGWRNGLNPSPLFDGNDYLQRYPDVAEASINPLVHYIISGAKEGRIYQSIYGAENEARHGWWDNIKYALTYPIRVQEEYYRLKAEIKELEKQD